MRTFRLLATLLLVALSMGFSSCGDDELEKDPIHIYPNENNGSSDLEKRYSQYIDDYENITCKSFVQYNDTIAFTGITSKGYLMIDLFQKSNETKVFEWIGNSKIDTTYRVHKGYGEYEEVKIHSIDISHIQFYNKLSKDFFAMIHLSGKELLKRALFVKGTHSKITDCFPNGMSTLILNWYNNEYCFIHDCCYTLAGDTVYTIKYGEYDYNIDQYGSRIATNGYGSFQYQFERVSAEEAIGVGIDTDVFCSSYQLRIARINYKTTKNVWGKQHYINLPFVYEANAKLSYDITNKSSKIWTYKVNITYYDGTKKEVTLNVNIENGAVQGEDDYNSLLDSYNSLLIVGKWKKTIGNAVATHVTYKNDGTFEYTSTEDSSYKEVGKYKIDGNKLYEMYSDEEEWIISNILFISTRTLSVQELETDGMTPTGKMYDYERVE